MDIVIEFFRDTLDGPFYIAWVVILVILIFACIGYLAEKGINKKKEKEKYATVVDDGTNSSTVVSDEAISTPVNTPVEEQVNNNSGVAEVPTSGVVPNSIVSEPVQSVNNDPINATTTSTQVQDVTPVPDTAVASQTQSTIVRPVAEVRTADSVVTPVGPQVQSNTNTVGTTNINIPSNEVNQVVIPTINQDENNNTF